MVAEGILDDPHVDAVYCLHLWSEHKSGVVLTRPGPMMAASDATAANARPIANVHAGASLTPARTRT